MLQTKLRPAYILTAIITILAIAASTGGLFIDGLYRDNLLVTSGWYGNDLVTLVVAVPMLVTALILSMRGSQRAQLIWLGMLDYTLYNYAFYLFGTAFNGFFLVYVALFALSIFALIFGLVALDVVVPWLVLGAIWLWQRPPWGYVLAAIANVKGVVYMLALAATTVSAALC
jgi:hypothetical protein